MLLMNVVESTDGFIAVSRSVEDAHKWLPGSDKPIETIYNPVTTPLLAEGKYTHDYPITAEKARELGLPVVTSIPPEVYALMELYPQTHQQRPGVEYIPRPPYPYTRRAGNEQG